MNPRRWLARIGRVEIRPYVVFSVLLLIGFRVARLAEGLVSVLLTVGVVIAGLAVVIVLGTVRRDGARNAVWAAAWDERCWREAAAHRAADARGRVEAAMKRDAA